LSRDPCERAAGHGGEEDIGEITKEYGVRQHGAPVQSVNGKRRMARFDIALST
jgi:hypothetical protein